MYLYITSGVMLLNGLVYCALGVCMLTPVRTMGKRHETHWNRAGIWYPSMFKEYLPLLQDTERPGVDDGAAVTNPMVEQIASKDLAFRLIAYLVFLLGFWRILTGLFWVCGFVFLGLGSCVAEIAIISLELLRHDSVMLHRTMLVLFLDVLLILIYSVPALYICL